MDPRFPPELERPIFLYAIHADAYSAQSLLLVAKRVREWILPEVYRTITVWKDDKPPVPFNYLTVGRYGKYIHELSIIEPALHLSQHEEMVGMTMSYKITEFLKRCPHLRSFTYWWRGLGDLPAIETMSGLPLKHLDITTHLIEKLGCSFPISNNSPIPSSLFPGVTHLKIIGLPFIERSETDLALSHHFPSVTHFCFHKFPSVDKDIALVLKTFPNLKLLVVWSPGPLGWDRESELPPSEEASTSTVIVPLKLTPECWKAIITRKSPNIWELAYQVHEEYCRELSSPPPS